MRHPTWEVEKGSLLTSEETPPTVLDHFTLPSYNLMSTGCLLDTGQVYHTTRIHFPEQLMCFLLKDTSATCFRGFVILPRS